MAKMNQVIAIEKGVKSRCYSNLTNLHKLLQKPDLFDGLSRVYLKNDEDGDDIVTSGEIHQMSTDRLWR